MLWLLQLVLLLQLLMSNFLFIVTVIIAHFRQLLSDCGIGVMDTTGADVAPAVNQHRVLIFCQLKSMLDIVEYDLLQYVLCVNF